MNGAFRRGSTLVLLPRFSGDAAIELMLAESVNTFHGVPTMYVGLLAAAEGVTDLPALRACVSGGAPLPTSVLRRFEDAFSPPSMRATGCRRHRRPRPRTSRHSAPWPGTVGHPIWGVDVQIARRRDRRARRTPRPGRARRGGDPRAQRVHRLLGTPGGDRDGTGGRLVPHRRSRPAGPRRLRVHRRPEEGRRHSRRIQRLPDRGRGGADPAPVGAQVAVIGLRDDVYGEEVVAVVVPRVRPPFPPEDEFIAWSREHLGAHKYPRRVFPWSPCRWDQARRC